MNAATQNQPSCASLVQQLATELLARGWKLVTAESCTGGMIAAACTDLAGSSEWFERGLVTYSNVAKAELLGVDAALLERHGAVSDAVVRAMARGAVGHARADVSIAVTGVAGPGGGSPQKPVGTVWLGWSVQGKVSSRLCHCAGDRAAIRRETVVLAIRGLLDLLGQSVNPQTFTPR